MTPTNVKAFLLSSVVAVTACSVSSEDAPPIDPELAPAIEMDPMASKKTIRCRTDSDCRPSSDPCHVTYCDLQGSPRCLLRAAVDGTACSDGDATTTNDVCQAGVCSGTPAPPPPPSAVCGDGVVSGDEVCDDGNQVTEASCPPGVTSCYVCDATCSAMIFRTGG